MQETNDDGSLAFLGIGKDPNNVQFHCEQTKQSKIVNTTFWVRDILDNVKTKHGDDQVAMVAGKAPDVGSNPSARTNLIRFIKNR